MRPQTHAYNVVEALVRLTEWNLATLEWRESLKSSSKMEVRRQREICRDAVWDCARFASVDDAKRMGAHRLEAIMLGNREVP